MVMRNGKDVTGGGDSVGPAGLARGISQPRRERADDRLPSFTGPYVAYRHNLMHIGHALMSAWAVV
jgi:hypothetical protein